MNHKNTSEPLHKYHDAEEYYTTQLKKVREYLRQTTASRYMAAIDTGIPIQNICRHVEMLKSTNSIAVVRKDYCRITGELVEYLSTNPDNFPKDLQLCLWE